MVEEEGAGRRWSIERAFGALNCSVNGIVDFGIDSKGEDARVEVSPTSREAINDICAWICSQSVKVQGFQSPRARCFICIHKYVFIRPLFISICMYVFIYIHKRSKVNQNT